MKTSVIETGQAFSARLQSTLENQATGLSMGGEMFTSEEVLASDGMLTFLLVLGFPSQAERNQLGMKWKASEQSLCSVELVHLFKEEVLLEECQRRVAHVLQFWANRGGDLEDLYLLHKSTMADLVDEQSCSADESKSNRLKRHSHRLLKS